MLPGASNPCAVNRLRAAAVVAVAVLLPVAFDADAQAAPAAPLDVAGLGGQSAVLVVGEGGLDVGYPFFTEPRVPGPDGAVGGVAIQRASDGRVVGGVLLQNAPGFDRALSIELADFGRTKLAPGRYRLTLLGSGKQAVHLQVLGSSTPRRLQAKGPVRPVTRTIAGGAPVLDSWSTRLGRVTATDYVVIGGGSGGDLQQAADAELCLQAGTAASDPCLVGSGGSMASPGVGSWAGWTSMLYRPGTLSSGSYVFSGHVVGVGPASWSGHAGVVLSLRR
jgi:hypothetical protein